MRLAFLGTPAPAVVVLQALLEAGHEVPIVVTRADARRGRRQEPSPSPVKAAATRAGIPVSHSPSDVVDAGVDLGVVVAYGKLIKPPLLGAVPLVNVHFSLLPRWRGAAPVERAILAGDEITGVCLMELEAGLDTGPLYARAFVAIGDRETAESLTDRLAHLGALLLVRTLDMGFPVPRPQEGESTYAARIDPSDLELYWDRPAVELDRLVRVGRAWTSVGGRRLIVWEVEVVPESGLAPGELGEGALVGTGEGGLRLLLVQVEGRRAVGGVEWARGAHLGSAARLGT
ncbi:MAG: methionyl-tRNA formyltransferase [Acidimicrobiales bacterium]